MNFRTHPFKKFRRHLNVVMDLHSNGLAKRIAKSGFLLTSNVVLHIFKLEKAAD